MVPGGFFIIIHGSRLLSHGFRWGFHDSMSVFPGWLFMIPCGFLRFSKIPGLVFEVPGWFS